MRYFGLLLLSSGLAFACGGSEATPSPSNGGGAPRKGGQPASAGAATLTCGEAAAPYTLQVTQLDPGVAPRATPLTAGDDIVRRPDGSIVWANVTNSRISVVTLTPG